MLLRNVLQCVDYFMSIRAIGIARGAANIRAYVGLAFCFSGMGAMARKDPFLCPYPVRKTNTMP